MTNLADTLLGKRGREWPMCSRGAQLLWDLRWTHCSWPMYLDRADLLCLKTAESTSRPEPYEVSRPAFLYSSGPRLAILPESDGWHCFLPNSCTVLWWFNECVGFRIRTVWDHTSEVQCWTLLSANRIFLSDYMPYRFEFSIPHFLFFLSFSLSAKNRKKGQ